MILPPMKYHYFFLILSKTKKRREISTFFCFRKLVFLFCFIFVPISKLLLNATEPKDSKHLIC